MSGRAARIIKPADRREGSGDAAITRPWFAPARLGARPWILTFVGTDESFIDVFFRGIQGSPGGFTPGSFPRLLPLRDFAEPPRALLDGGGAPTYQRGHVEPAAGERPGAGELELDGAASFEAALTDAGIDAGEAFPPGGDATRAAWLRKLYLPVHTHFHVVACELICERPGAPRIDPKRVIEAGMVVRRFLPDRTSGEARWEDWIPSPHGGGVWVELAGAEMRTIHGESRAIDPGRLPPDALGAAQAEILARLGFGDVPADLTLGLSTHAMAALPVTVGEAAKHTARFGFLPLGQSDKERPPLEPGDDAAAIAQALAEQAEAHLDERVVSQAQAIRDRVRGALLPLLARFRDTLPARPAAADVTLAWTAIAVLTGATHADISANARTLGMAALTRYADRTLAVPDPESRWESAVDETLDTPPAPLDPWVTSATSFVKAHLRLVSLEEAWSVVDAVLPAPATLADPIDQRLLVALLLWIRRLRVGLLHAFHVAALPAGQAPDLDEYVAGSSGSLPLRAPTSSGAMGAELEAWLSANDARQDDPVPWDPPWPPASPPADPIEVHRLSLALEAALEDVEAQGAGAGGAYAEVLDQRVGTAVTGLHEDLGYPLLVARGIDLRVQPERGLLVFPGASPTAATLGDLRNAIMTRYAQLATAKPDAVRAEGKAARNLILTRFDADHLYAVWCYARVRGKHPCEEPQIVWSRRTEAFSLAEPMDLLGLKPVSIRLPDLPRLLRDMPRMKKARALPFAAITTPRSSGVSTGETPKDTAREWGIAWICSFAIPVFTIFAWIAFKIIFSILIILPSFTWMLLLKFCIPVPAPKKS